MKPKRWTPLALVAAGVLVGAALTVSFDWLPALSAQSSPALEKQQKLRADLRKLEKSYQPFTEALVKAAELVRPSVVRIVVETKGRPKRLARRRMFRGRPFDLWRWFEEGRDPREFFKEFQFPNPEDFPHRGVGSGIIIDPKGYILTNEHVIQGYKNGEIRVTLFGEKESVVAKVWGEDPKSDLAVIRIKMGRPLPALTFADPGSIRVGQVVLAVGHPFDYSYSVSHGIISHTGRRNALRGLRRGSFVVEDYIQTDASINPGNSGGPLVNLRGEIVGVNSFIATRTGGSVGLGFAMSSRVAKKVAMELIKHRKVIRGYLGVTITDITDEAAEQFGLTDAKEMVKKLKLKGPEGALVMKVEPGTPAAKAGLEAQDVIVEYDGHPVRSPGDLTGLVRNTEVGAKVKIKVMRDGKPKVLTAKIAEQPESLKTASVTVRKLGKGGQLKVMGMTVQTLTPELAKRLGMPGVKGVLVTEVEENSAAAQAGVEPNDVIISVGFEKIETAEQLQDKLEQAERTGRGIVVNIKGKGMVILK